ncbi:MAG: ROK family protein [Ignavibacterium sp.]
MRFGIDFGGTNIKFGIFSDDGKTISFTEEKLNNFIASGNLLDNLTSFAKTFINNYSITKGGLAIKGFVNKETGILEDDIGAGLLLSKINLIKEFSDKLQIPFCVENDARCYAWGEYLFGAGKNSKALVCMTLGTGLGCALIVDGKFYYGADLLGGLLGGHISIDKDGPDCPCGNKGCLELYCSATALTKRINENFPKLKNNKDTLPIFFDLIRNENEKYIFLFNSFINELSIGIVNIIHAYNPDKIVLGGGIMNSADLIMPPLIKLVKKRAWTIPRGKVEIVPSLLKNKAATMGVAFLE